MSQFTETGLAVYNRTYSRTKPDGTKEVWPETVRRVVDGNLALNPTHLLPNEREDLIELMESFKILPAGRHLWASGVPGRQFLFNCWVSGWTEQPSEHFRYTFLRLMEGGGVGANYSNHLLPKAAIRGTYRVHIVCDPEHPDYAKMDEAGLLSHEFGDDWQGAFAIEDSREGWADGLVDLIDTYYRENVKHVNRVYDVSYVRREGARLKTFGGRASGPLPFARMMHEVNDTLNGIPRYTLNGVMTGLDAMEIDHAIATCVVSGGNRRSARMSIMHWADPQIEEFIRVKQESGSHWTTNISVEVDDEFFELADEGVCHPANYVRNDIAEGMLANGEPGIWNSSLSNEGEPNLVTCTNPCLTGDTVIATLSGPRTFADLAESGQDVEVYSWDPKTKRPVVRWMRRPHKTQENAELLAVTFDSGLVVRCTPEHSFYTFRGKKVQAKDLKPGKSIRAFSASRDGSGHERVHGWDSVRNAADHQWTHRMIWENEHGPVPEGEVIAHLDHNSRNNELANLAAMTPYDHASYDYPLRAANGFNGQCRNHKVLSVEPAGREAVYNGMVEGSHTYIVLDPKPIAGHMSGIVSANCGEIALEPWEPCNLGHVNLSAFVTPHGNIDIEGLTQAHHLVTRFLIRATYGDVSDPKSAAVLARNRRIGVGHFGFASMLGMMGIRYADAPEDRTVEVLLADMAIEVDNAATEYAHDLRIPVPVKTRTVAPTGTIAKMPGVSEGIHPIFAKYFIRRIRFSTADPDQRATLEDYRLKGYKVEWCKYAPLTKVVEIPTKDSLMAEVESRYGQVAADDIVQSSAELTLSEMLAVQEMYQELWADNAVSYTANIQQGAYTAEDIALHIQEFGPRLKGVTMFPDLGMEQSPYEHLSKEQYQEYTIRHVADSVDENCAAGSCPVR